MTDFVDLYSDTKTRPCAAMRAAISNAVVGDEQHGEDPTVIRLTDRAAAYLGKESAVFLPSGTMANEIAILAQCDRGDELIAHHDSHIVNFEGGAAAALGGVMVRTLGGARGMFAPADLQRAIRRNARHLPRTRMVSIEQTTNLGGGAVWPVEVLDEISDIAANSGLRLHMDGARLINAVVAGGPEAARHAAPFDTVYMDFTKGLGAPVGAVLAGDAETIGRAWVWKQRLGGSLRQAGILAEACLYALDNNIGRIRHDHDNARHLADRLKTIDGVRVRPVETNMVFFDIEDTGLSAHEFNRRLQKHDTRVSIQAPFVLRAVTHLGVDRAGIDHAAEAMRSVLEAR